jgi:hypothetical protein
MRSLSAAIRKFDALSPPGGCVPASSQCGCLSVLPHAVRLYEIASLTTLSLRSRFPSSSTPRVRGENGPTALSHPVVSQPLAGLAAIRYQKRSRRASCGACPTWRTLQNRNGHSKLQDVRGSRSAMRPFEEEQKTRGGRVTIRLPLCLIRFRFHQVKIVRAVRGKQTWC